jgi:transcription initiation factor TFIID subunit 12
MAAPSKDKLPPGVTKEGEDRRLLQRVTLRELIKRTLNADTARFMTRFIEYPAAHASQVPHEVEELLLDVGDDFLEHTTAGAAALAKHRGSDTLDASDVRLHVERVWGMQLPGHGGSGLLTKRAAPERCGPASRGAQASRLTPVHFCSDAHAARLACIKRTVAAAVAQGK